MFMSNNLLSKHRRILKCLGRRQCYFSAYCYCFSGTYILTTALIPALKKAEDPRVVGFLLIHKQIYYFSLYIFVFVLCQQTLEIRNCHLTLILF